MSISQCAKFQTKMINQVSLVVHFNRELMRNILPAWGFESPTFLPKHIFLHEHFLLPFRDSHHFAPLVVSTLGDLRAATKATDMVTGSLTQSHSPSFCWFVLLLKLRAVTIPRFVSWRHILILFWRNFSSNLDLHVTTSFTWRHEKSPNVKCPKKTRSRKQALT